MFGEFYRGMPELPRLNHEQRRGAGCVNGEPRDPRVVISRHPRRIGGHKLDADLYKWRHLIENFFCKIKDFKRIAMRACKTDQNFSAMIYLTAAAINSR